MKHLNLICYLKVLRDLKFKYKFFYSSIRINKKQKVKVCQNLSKYTKKVEIYQEHFLI